MVAAWNPSKNMSNFSPCSEQAFKLDTEQMEPVASQLDPYATRTVDSSETQVCYVCIYLTHSEKPMTAFDSLLWNVWLPKVRSCINDNWSRQDPHPAVRLYEAWSTFLPPFIQDDILDQLILPKVKKAVAKWNPRKDTVPLRTLVFPWLPLPHVGLCLEDVMADAG
jgi:tuftelin-interacting protein 11